jgi:hypothetical protein
LLLQCAFLRLSVALPNILHILTCTSHIPLLRFHVAWCSCNMIWKQEGWWVRALCDGPC